MGWDHGLTFISESWLRVSMREIGILRQLKDIPNAGPARIAELATAVMILVAGPSRAESEGSFS
jgi:hypothetical protein